GRQLLKRSLRTKNFAEAKRLIIEATRESNQDFDGKRALMSGGANGRPPSRADIDTMALRFLQRHRTRKPRDADGLLDDLLADEDDNGALSLSLVSEASERDEDLRRRRYADVEPAATALLAEHGFSAQPDSREREALCRLLLKAQIAL